ncbi:alpha/beta fold hydrolase [Pseudonocardia sp. TRM90224]|uniref:alpha/beta fold hydrolase n=1 Tax=Pseudonocardia sp. TRM90224 TaxID=2812678 RepID=UPI001E40CBAB|nr:alpha/beta hydrolase [Pseudonocardia sp. TRM90224]
MKKLIAALALTATLLAPTGCAAASEPAAAPSPGRYADVNGLHMYYEVHGPDQGRPLVLLHGALSGINTDFGELLPELAKTRRVIAIEQQAHGHTADIDRPLRMQQMAADTVALLRSIGVQQADFFGYSLGAGIAFEIGVTNPDLVHKLVLTSLTFSTDGLHPGLLDGLQSVTPEMMHGSPFHEGYLATAPRPQDFPKLIEKNKDMQLNLPSWSPEVVKALAAPALIVIGDSDIVRPEHSVEFFRLLGGGVVGDMVGLPKSRLAIVPGATHVTVVHQPAVLLAIIPPFLEAA